MYSIGGPDGPVYFEVDGNGYIVRAANQSFSEEGSPWVVTVDPPIGPINVLYFGDMYQQLMEIISQA